MDFLERDFTILVVEDQVFIASELSDAVRRNGGRVLGPATRVSEALALIETARCDGALLDVHLGMRETVFPVAERLYAEGIAFVFVTGCEEDFGKRYGDVPVLKKPFGEAELDRCLRMLMGRVLRAT